MLCLDDYHLNDREGRKKSGLTALNLAEQDFGTSPNHFRTRAIDLARAGYAQTSTRAPRTGPEGLTRDLRYFFRDAERATLLRLSFSSLGLIRVPGGTVRTFDRRGGEMPRGHD